MAFSQPHSIITAWLQELQDNNRTNPGDDPNYWASDASTLITTSAAISFKLGTGHQIISSIVPACIAAQHEVIIVTCFWARSPSQETICYLLRKLSSKAVAQNRKIQVRLCFSSISLFQKLFQTASLNGKLYPPKSWTRLGLPPPEELQGLELVVKSVFVRPFSVMHPKFILLDRKVAFMPSFNVSWENWFEGCVEMRGGIVEKLFDFWSSFWSRGGAHLPPLSIEEEYSTPVDEFASSPPDLLDQIMFTPKPTPTKTILLPSPHHINPRFVTFQSPPPTPLNIFLLKIFSYAHNSIFIQTPNVTSKPVLHALFSALERGVNIHLITSRKLMVLEQLVTAGTTTEFEIWRLRRRYRRLLADYERTLSNSSDPENLMEKPGSLEIGYYHPRAGAKSENEPVKTHLKLVIMDEEIVVLGSGNQDRASWYTSQELGVAFLDVDRARDIRRTVDEALEGRVDYVS